MLRSLQACRAIAAILVVFYHTNNGIFDPQHYFGPKPFGAIFDFGFAGVDFFFVLSGFLMLHVHARDLNQPRAFGAYLWKRFSRIYPFYWVILAAVVPIYLLMPHVGTRHEYEPDVILCSVFLYPHPHNYQVLGVAWSLVYEVLFYLLFGLWILHTRLGITVFLIWTGCLLVYPWFAGNESGFLFNSMHLRFLAGMGVALALQRWQIPRPRLVATAGMAIFLCAGMFEAYAGPLSVSTRIVGFTLGSALTLMGLVEAERSGLLKTPNWLVYLGNASYSIYLVHYLALAVIAKTCKRLHVDQHVPLAALFVLHVVGAVVAGCLCHHWIEHPLHVWSKRFFRRAIPAVAVAEVASQNARKAA